MEDVFEARKCIFDTEAFSNTLPAVLYAPPPLQFMPPASSPQPQVVTRTVVLPTPPAAPPAPENIDGLIQQLQRLQVNDPEYANTYTQLGMFILRPATIIHSRQTSGNMLLLQRHHHQYS